MRKVLQKLALLGIIASLSAFTLGGCQKTTESKETQTEAKSEAKADETKQEEETESTDKAMQYVKMAYGPETDNSATATARRRRFGERPGKGLFPEPRPGSTVQNYLT